MPKIVDHEQRRRELAAAVWRVVREHGVQGASLRAVARQAGWSPSSVQYYFASQGELLDFAMRVVYDLTERRLARHDPPADPRDAAFALFELLLPLDAQTRRANEVWLAFLSRALVDSAARELNLDGNRKIARVCRQALNLLAEGGCLRPGADLELETARLHALFDGVALHAVTDPERMPPDRALRIFEHHLTSLIDPRHADAETTTGTAQP
ncbi:TetR family transcriptional regulator C-terminal domain-containing protein [Actinomadura sp. B10D3]|uniref:TetR/AcrR family transcriptional regulator n=1 Tax=Actinomadura sp. B10D3 TaxID=3153557 RepID=UPI00325EB1FE